MPTPSKKVNPSPAIPYKPDITITLSHWQWGMVLERMTMAARNNQKNFTGAIFGDIASHIANEIRAADIPTK